MNSNKAGILAAVTIVTIMVVWITSSSNSNSATNGSGEQSSPQEIVKIVEREQFLNTPYGRLKIAILERQNGELRDIALGRLTGMPSPVITEIPADVQYAYVTFRAGPPTLRATSFVPIFSK